MVSAPLSGRSPREVTSAGVVVFGPGRTVLVVHRPKYDDWSFPKGKLDRGEPAVAAAVRETLEETGVKVRLGLPLASQRYPIRGGVKNALYWTGRPVGAHDISTYLPNAEIDEVRWVSVKAAGVLLSYDRDRETLAEAVAVRKRTRTVIVQRHGVARARGAWRRDDALRPLLVLGRRQAQRLAPFLEAYGAARLVSSTSLRCTETLATYAADAGLNIETDAVFSEEHATPKAVGRAMAKLLIRLQEAPKSEGALVVCSHRPVLPWIFETLGLDDPLLEKGEMLVVHLRGGQPIAVERHLPG